MGRLSFTGKALASWFQSVTPTTAGFSTIDIAGMRSATQFLFIILMFIGVSPVSTGGGIKTSTFGAVLLMKQFAVIGLGRFGSSVAKTLTMMGTLGSKDIPTRNLWD